MKFIPHRYITYLNAFYKDGTDVPDFPILPKGLIQQYNNGVFEHPMTRWVHMISQPKQYTTPQIVRLCGEIGYIDITLLQELLQRNDYNYSTFRSLHKESITWNTCETLMDGLMYIYLNATNAHLDTSPLSTIADIMPEHIPYYRAIMQRLEEYRQKHFVMDHIASTNTSTSSFFFPYYNETYRNLCHLLEKKHNKMTVQLDIFIDKLLNDKKMRNKVLDDGLIKKLLIEVQDWKLQYLILNNIAELAHKRNIHAIFLDILSDASFSLDFIQCMYTTGTEPLKKALEPFLNDNNKIDALQKYNTYLNMAQLTDDVANTERTTVRRFWYKITQQNAFMLEYNIGI